MAKLTSSIFSSIIKRALKTMMMVMILALSLSCSVKRDFFIGVEDSPYVDLPNNAPEQAPAYYVPPKNADEDALEFINRPRPQPTYIGETPGAFVESRNSFSGDRQIDLGINSLKQASLRITPYNDRTDYSDVLAAIEDEGFVPDLEETDYLTEQYVSNQMLLRVYKYPTSIMLSISTIAASGRQGRNNEIVQSSITEAYVRLDNLRDSLLSL